MNYVLKKRIIALPVLFLICHLTMAQNPFASPKEISEGGIQGISALVAADLNGDNLKDVVVFSGKLPGKNIVFEWYEQKAENEWQKHELNHYGLLGDKNTDFIGSAQACDFDGDGDMDFVFTVDGHKTGPIKVWLWENPGHDKCSQKNWPHHLIASFTGVHANDMRLGDMDGDGKTDIVIRHKEPDDVKILFQNNLKNWEIKSALPGYEGEGLALGDLNNNGRIDIAFTGYWFKAPENPRNEDYSSAFIIDENFHSTNPGSKDDIGDINGDGRNDVIISPAESWPNYGGDNYVLAWYECPENPEAGTWTQHIIEDNFNEGHFIRLADFDADGNLDIVSGRAWNTIDLRLYLNEGGKFKKGITIAEGTGGYSGAVLDMDNDGDTDMVIEDNYSDKNKPWFFENLNSSTVDRSAITPSGEIKLFNGTDMNGLHVWFEESEFDDPANVVSVSNNNLHITGEKWGAVITDDEYIDYVMVFEYKWGSKTWGKREFKARDGGVLFHSKGDYGGWNGKLIPNIQVQVMEGSTGDLLILPPAREEDQTFAMEYKAVVKKISKQADTWNYRDGYLWNPAGTEKAFNGITSDIFATVHWKDWDPAWEDEKGFRSANDVENPSGEWNQLILICKSDSASVYLNGVKVNEVYDIKPMSGKLQIEIEFAEIYVRRWDIYPLDEAILWNGQPVNFFE